MPVDVSVVIPTYKRNKLLKNCLMSLQNQSFPKQRFEVIVVSDGSDLACRKMMASMEKENESGICIRYFELAEKKGPAAARNEGWKNARGRLIVFTDDDCLPLPDFISTFWDEWEKNPLALIAFRAKMKVPVKDPPTDFERNTSFLEGDVFVTANCACTKAALKRVNGFDEQFTMAWREDSDLEFGLIKNGIPVQFIPRITVVHPVRKAPWGISVKEQKKTMFNVLLYKKYPRLFKEKITRGPAWYYYVYILLFVLLITTCYYKQYEIAALLTIVWGAWISWFILKRLKGTSLSPSHITEMVVTSLVIPFASLFWTWWGIVKYKKLYV